MNPLNRGGKLGKFSLLGISGAAFSFSFIFGLGGCVKLLSASIPPSISLKSVVSGWLKSKLGVAKPFKLKPVLIGVARLSKMLSIPLELCGAPQKLLLLLIGETVQVVNWSMLVWVGLLRPAMGHGGFLSDILERTVYV